MGAARRWADLILECAPLSVRASKEAALRGLDLPLKEAMADRYEQVRVLLKSEDRIEGPRALPREHLDG